MITENGKPVIAKLHRCIDGRAGRRLLAGQRELRDQLTTNRRALATPNERTAAALVEAGRRNLANG